MSRYRKIDVRMWGDAKFKALSSPEPNGKDCWIYLLTNQYTTSIPGLYHAFPETLARGLGWPVEGFAKAFREVIAQGLAEVDEEVGLIFVPNAIAYAKPESPNVVKGWATAWDELPECTLKSSAWAELAGFVETMSEGFSEAFRKACPQPLANQEQEQEQELFSLFSPSGSLGSDSDACAHVNALDLGEPDNEKQKRIVDKHLTTALQVLEALNAARKRVRPSSTGIGPTYTSLGGIAARLAARRSLEQCLRVVAVGEAECTRKPDSFDWFDAITPWRPENFEKRAAMDPGAHAPRSVVMDAASAEKGRSLF